MSTTQTPLLAGLSEVEANQKVCDWLTKRTGRNHYFNEDCNCIYVEKDSSKWQFGVSSWKPFQESHGSVHSVISLMNHAELAAMVSAVNNLWKADTFPEQARIAWLLRATPAQKFESILRALGMAREGESST